MNDPRKRYCCPNPDCDFATNLVSDLHPVSPGDLVDALPEDLPPVGECPLCYSLIPPNDDDCATTPQGNTP